MNTIVRAIRDNHLLVDETVKETVFELRKNAGIYTINDIRMAINTQLPNPIEHVTRKMVVHAMVRLLGKSNKRAIDRRIKA
jgi:hypothetical protein